MDLRKLKTLIDLVADSSVTELEITEGEEKVRIVKGGSALPMVVPNVQNIAQNVKPVLLSEPQVIANPDSKAAQEIVSGHVVKSPMVGTFYRAVNPNAKPFVDVGQTVKKGDPLCLIEAMKILNEVESDIDGVIREVLISNGQAVEYGQPLFVVDLK